MRAWLGPGPTPAEARDGLAGAAAWAADYLERVGDLPVGARVTPGEVAAMLPAHPPRQGEPIEDILADVDRVILPGITHWNHPAFFAYFGITGSAPGVMGELIAAALDTNAMLWSTSPAATELEERMAVWVAQLIGLPTSWFGITSEGASASTLWALAAAREAAGVDVRRRGLAGRDDVPPLRVYASAEAHSSVEKACIVLGLGQAGCAKIETDDAFRLRADALARAVESDVAAGVRPIAAVATVGTTSSTSIDPVPAVADVCAAHGMWLHVDAAYGGAAGVVPEYRHVLAGCERADSLVVNPHKWLFTPIGCSLLYTARPDHLRAAFSIVPEYLRDGAGETANLMEYGTTLGRPFRALKLWMVLRAYGAEGIAEVIRRHVELAGWLAGEIDAAPDWERLAPTPLSTVCFRLHPPGVDSEAELDGLNEALLERVNRTGETYLSHTRLAGRYTLRVAIGNVESRREHVERAWRALRDEAAALQ
jgi:aromatic-L-amino-acid decarboxylase